ncbi:MAG TPA: helix-turn-helix transcriptional regulator [Alphaproteobacteria bacterium]|nr:helix-turn-helix transcriptional regulator [Alphaproteobacteria bacterium]
MGRKKSEVSQEERIEISNRIKELRSKIGLTRAEIQTKYGLNVSTLRSVENQSNALSLSLAKKLAIIASENGVDCSIEWLMEGKGSPPFLVSKEKWTKKNPVTQLSTMVKGIVESQTLSIAFDVHNFLQSYKDYDPEILKISDDAMAPQFKSGDYVGGIPVTIEKINNFLDTPFILELENGKKVLRYVTVYEKRPMLYCTNFRHEGSPKLIFNPVITKACPVFWHRMFLSPWTYP